MGIWKSAFVSLLFFLLLDDVHGMDSRCFALVFSSSLFSCSERDKVAEGRLAVRVP